MVSSLLCHIRVEKSKEKIGATRLRLIARWRKLRSRRPIRRAQPQAAVKTCLDSFPDPVMVPGTTQG